MASDTPVTPASEVVVPAASETPLVVNEINDDSKVGEFVGQCKWFNDKLGYGFITIQAGKDKGKDIFVHHSGIQPLNSNYKTLKKGEYVNFNIINGDNGLQAVDVTGIGGGSLMCDVLPAIKFNIMNPVGVVPGIPPSAPIPSPTNGFTPVSGRRPFTGGAGRGGRGVRGRGNGGYGGGRGAPRSS
jgi:cold shock protein